MSEPAAGHGDEEAWPSRLPDGGRRLGLAAGVAAAPSSGAPRWLVRALYVAAAGFALGAFALLAFVNARVPPADLE